MGCCCSRDKDRDSQNEDVDERTRLLGNPVSNNAPAQRMATDDYGHSGSVPRRTDEQSALNKILQQTATNVIDVAALDAHNLEQHEYVERSRLYVQRMQAAQVGLKYNRMLNSKASKGVLADVSGVERVLSEQPISTSDFQFMKYITLRASKAMADLRVEHKEDLVVQFAVA